ncbi:MAG TPA: cyclic nucleotide-binding domain-containing protein, partial [Candidatus Binatus sp.]|nr:cyclic nucleotide-binding domain-containing protein [Candidatus Binatus sp.]
MALADVYLGGGPPCGFGRERLCKGNRPNAVGGPRAAALSMVKARRNSMNAKSQTAFAEPKTNEISLLNRANVFETGLSSWGVPPQIAEELIRHHTKVNYEDGKLIFGQGSPADIVLWVVKGVVREICSNPNGTQTLVRLATTGDILGLADKLNEKGEWVRR